MPEGGFRTGLLIGALAVGVIALGVAVVVLVTQGDDDTPEPPTVVSTVTASTDAPVDTTTSAPPASADCGDVADGGTGIYNVEAENLECTEATGVARAWERDCLGPPGACSAAGFQCESLTNGERADVTCREGSAVVRFAFASYDPP